ncbi:MAG: hypothetical protein JWO31_1867 [Phycisphaerales bacterium]|nr:hypothetical protein [Phycisphaerales bacterium]
MRESPCVPAPSPFRFIRSPFRLRPYSLMPWFRRNPARRAAVRRRPSLDVSLVGLVYMCMMLFMGLAAINSGANLLYGVFGLMIGILLLAGVLSKRVLRTLTVHRALPGHANVGRPATISYRFTNGKRFLPSLSVTVSELDAAGGFAAQPQAYMLHAAAGESSTVPADVVPRRRGLHHFGRFQISTSFPFGFVRRAVTDAQPDRLLVYPAVGRVDPAVLDLCRGGEHIGSSMRPRQGGQDEFYGLKEHRAGDSPRNIYWKRSARTASTTGVLVAREMTQVSPPRVMLLVDTWLPAEAAGIDRATAAAPAAAAASDVERTVAMAASLASAAIDLDLTVGLLGWDGAWRRIEPSRGKRHLGDLLSFLARLPPNPSADTGQLLEQGVRLARNGTTAVLFTPRPAAGPDAGRRGAVVVLSADDERTRRWFTFDPGVEFADGPSEAAPSQADHAPAG